MGVAAKLTDIEVDQLAVPGYPHFLSGLSPSICTSKQRQKLLGRCRVLFQEEQGCEGNMTHLSPPTARDSTVTRKISKFSTDSASGVSRSQLVSPVILWGVLLLPTHMGACSSTAQALEYSILPCLSQNPCSRKLMPLLRPATGSS